MFWKAKKFLIPRKLDNVVVTATAAKGVIPEGAQFVVTPIEKGSDQYADIEKQLHEGAENESYTVAGFLAYDISFLNDDGTKIEPQNGSVRVSIAYKEAEIPEDVAETDNSTGKHEGISGTFCGGCKW